MARRSERSALAARTSTPHSSATRHPRTVCAWSRDSNFSPYIYGLNRGKTDATPHPCCKRKVGCDALSIADPIGREQETLRQRAAPLQADREPGAYLSLERLDSVVRPRPDGRAVRSDSEIADRVTPNSRKPATGAGLRTFPARPAETSAVSDKQHSSLSRQRFATPKMGNGRTCACAAPERARLMPRRETACRSTRSPSPSAWTPSAAPD